VERSAQDELGPWPQPAPRFFEDAAPAVLHVPEAIQKDWDRHLGRRYLRQVIFESLPALVWALNNPGLEPVSDARFVEILCDGIFSKLLVERARFDEPDETAFAPYLDGSRGPGPAERGWYKADFSAMRLLPSDSDSATSPSVVLFRRRGDGGYELVAISIEGHVFDPSHEGAWTVAKYFALQGAGVITTLLMHPKVHFPSNAIDAITRTRLPDGALRRLLLPHFRLAIAVNFSVLYGSQTVLKPGQLYSPYPGTLQEHSAVIAALWSGLEHEDGTPNRAYPRYELQPNPPRVHSPYGEFLKRYFEALRPLVDAVVDEATPLDEDARQWADYCARWLPGFPDAAAVAADRDQLVDALTSILLDVSVAHSADHFLYGQVNEREVPFRLYADVPSSDDRAAPDRRRLVRWVDNFNYRMCMRMFFEPHVVARLQDVDYGFEEPSLREAQEALRERIRGMDEELRDAKVPVYVPAREIATSVQF
jgi:hypothetical protein